MPTMSTHFPPLVSSRWVLYSAALLLSGCLSGIGAPPQEVGKSEEDLKKEIYHLSKQMGELKEADERNRSANAGLSQRVSMLENELAKARGELEKAQNQNRRMTEQLTTLEKKAPPPPVATTSPSPATESPTGPSPAAMLAGDGGAPSAPAAAKPAPPPPEAVRAQDLTRLAKQEEAKSAPASYESAFLLLKSGQFDKSLEEFQQFLKDKPNDELADNAQYWVGELHLAQKRFPDALTAFNQVLVRWPASDKVPPSLLKIGFAFDEMGDFDNARVSLEKLVKDFPASPSVPLAKQRLKQINEAHPPKKK